MQKCNQNGLERRFSREVSSANPAKAVELTEVKQGSVAVGLVGLEKQEVPQKEKQTAHRAEQSNRSRILRKIGDFKQATTINLSGNSHRGAATAEEEAKGLYLPYS